MLMWQMSQYNLTKLFRVRLKTTKCYQTILWRKTKNDTKHQHTQCITDNKIFCSVKINVKMDVPSACFPLHSLGNYVLLYFIIWYFSKMVHLLHVFRDRNKAFSNSLCSILQMCLFRVSVRKKNKQSNHVLLSKLTSQLYLKRVKCKGYRRPSGW